MWICIIMHDSTITSTDILPCTLSCLSCDYPYWLRLVCWYVHEANWSHTGGTCVSGTFSNGICDKNHALSTFIHSTLTREANAGKPESWENLTYDSNTDNDPKKAPNNCSHAETQGHIAIMICICVLFMSVAGIRLQVEKCKSRAHAG